MGTRKRKVAGNIDLPNDSLDTESSESRETEFLEDMQRFRFRTPASALQKTGPTIRLDRSP
jgi:hypothetical protein